MKYEILSMTPKDGFDVILRVALTPDWYNLGGTSSYASYYGSGTTWWESSTDRRVDGWTSGTLHDLWNDQLNKELEKKNCY